MALIRIGGISFNMLQSGQLVNANNVASISNDSITTGNALANTVIGNCKGKSTLTISSNNAYKNAVGISSDGSLTQITVTDTTVDVSTFDYFIFEMVASDGNAFTATYTLS